MDEMLDDMEESPAKRGVLAHMSKTEARILYTRNLLLILLSLCVGGRVVLSILASWRSAALSPVRKFSHFLMGVLLTVELVQCVVWFLGMTLAALNDDTIPNAGTLNLRLANTWCYPLGILTYWLDLMNSLWHAVVACKVWCWVYRRQPVYVLCRNLIYMVVAAVLLATGLTLVPILERTIDLTPHSHCFLTTFWKKDGHPTAAFMLDRWVVLPICWFAVAGFNLSTIYVLKREAQHLPVSVYRLELRLLLVTISFCVLWGLMAVPPYLFVGTFAADFLLRWNLAMAFVDAICYGFPESLDVTRWIVHCCPSLAAALTGGLTGRHRSSSHWVSMTTPANPVAAGEGGRLSQWMQTFRSFHTPPPEVLYPHRIFLTTFDEGHTSLPPSNLFSLMHRNYLAEGLEQWLPLGGYHIYGIAVQKSHHLSKLRDAIHDYLGGNAKYTLVATAELNDASHSSKTALMLFVRTVDVESGAFRLTGLNKNPVRASRTGTKGLVGLSFRFYDQSMAIINAHLPAVGQYGGDEMYRARHVAAMLHEFRMDAEHELFDTHLQYHHVFLLGNLNSHTRGLTPPEMLAKVVESAKACQGKLERVRHRGMDWNWRSAGYNRFWSTGTGGSSGAPVFPLGPGGAVDSDNSEERKEEEVKEHGEDETWMGTLEMGLRGARRVVMEPLTGVAARDWAWVKEVDGLLWMMRQGFLFAGFEESPIAFPPTYKWNEGASADDFIVPSVVEQAYTTHDIKHPLVDVTPSFSDRILHRSVPDMAHRLNTLAYDAVEKGPLATASDHRPVSAAFTVMLDTAHPLALYAGPIPRRLSAISSESLGSTSSTHTAPRYGEATDLATAMAGAARMRRGPVSPPTPVYARPNPQTAFPPILVTVCLSSFRFRFAGFRNIEGFNRGGPVRGIPEDSLYHHQHGLDEGQGAGGHGTNLGVEQGNRQLGWEGGFGESEKEEETKEEGGSEEEHKQQPLLLRRSDSSELSWVSGITEGEYGISGETDSAANAAAAASAATAANDAAVSASVQGLVEEVVILYPLPCEDPLWNFRHYQALDESMKLGGRCGSSSNGTTRERTLRNLHQMSWRPELEAYDEEDRSQLLRGMGRLEMDVLTLAPLPSTQHALIKFLRRNKRELGQGVMCVRSDMFEEITSPSTAGTTSPTDPSHQPVPSLPSLPRLLREKWSAASGGGEGSSSLVGRTTGSFSSTQAVVMPPSTCPSSGDSDLASRPTAAAADGGGGLKLEKERQCQTVMLSVGGDFRGTVEFACDLKIRRRAKDGSRLRVPEGDEQSSHGGEGRVTTFARDESRESEESY